MLSKMRHQRIVGFIDRRAAEIISFCSLPVFALEDVRLDLNAVVIVAVKNVFEHQRIAKQLMTRGFTRLVYRPRYCLDNDGDEDENAVNDAYTKIYEEGVTVFKDLPVLGSGTKIRYPKPLEETTDDCVVAPVPVSLVFTDSGKTDRSICILCLRSHIEFAKYVLGMGGTSQHYLGYCERAALAQGLEITDAWRANVIANRAEVFAQMHHKRQVDPTFFIRTAPLATWDSDSGVFRLHSGKHRAAYLAAIEANYVPLKMTRSDYESFCNKDEVESFAKKNPSFLDESLPYPVESPSFYSEAVQSEAFFYSLLRSILAVVAEMRQGGFSADCPGFSMYIDINDGGFLSRLFSRFGARVFSKHLSSVDKELAVLLKAPTSLPADISREYDLSVQWASESASFPVRAKKMIVLSDSLALPEGRQICHGVLMEGRECFAYLLE